MLRNGVKIRWSTRDSERFIRGWAEALRVPARIDNAATGHAANTQSRGRPGDNHWLLQVDADGQVTDHQVGCGDDALGCRRERRWPDVGGAVIVQLGVQAVGGDQALLEQEAAHQEPGIAATDREGAAAAHVGGRQDMAGQ